MPIQVVTPTYPVTFLDGIKYHTDSDGGLHVISEDGNLAAFAPNQWVYARLVSEREVRDGYKDALLRGGG